MLIPPVKYLDHNTTGRDFAVGDVHGCIAELLEALNLIGFDFETDRLFSVGDMIDRGPDSEETFVLLGQKWFHMIKGNHEDMMIKEVLYPQQAQYSWIMNGGYWGIELSEQQRFDYCHALEQLPTIIVLGKGADRINLVHAELYDNNSPITDETIDAINDAVPDYDRLLTIALWGRTLHSMRVAMDSLGLETPTDLSLTICGHTPVEQPIRIGQHVFIDTGAVYAERERGYDHLTLLEINSKQIFQYHMRNKVLETPIALDSIKRFG